MLQISLSSFRSTTLLNNFFIPNYLNLSPAIQAHSPEFTFPTSLSVSPFNPFQRKAADLLEDFSHAHSSQFLLIAFVKGTNLSKGELCSLRTGKLYHVLLKGQLLSGYDSFDSILDEIRAYFSLLAIHSESNGRSSDRHLCCSCIYFPEASLPFSSCFLFLNSFSCPCGDFTCSLSVSSSRIHLPLLSH